MKYKMLDNPAINHLREVGVWFPGDPKLIQGDEKALARFEGALQFWGPVFGWVGRATDEDTVKTRMEQARGLSESLWFDLNPEFRVYLQRGYYHQNKEKARQFYQQIQSLPNVTWRVIVHPRGHKGYQFTLVETKTPQDHRQEDPTTPQSSTVTDPTVIDGLEDLL